MNLDRQHYVAECSKRWHGVALGNAVANWASWQAIHNDLAEAVQSFKRNPHQEDIERHPHNPTGSLTSFLWNLQSAWQPDKSRLDPLLDFCDHYQTVFLRRGLFIYCQMLLKQKPEPNPDQPALL